MESEETTETTRAEQQLETLEKRIPYNSLIIKNETEYKKVLERLLEDSNFIGLSLRYPFDDTKTELPDYPKYDNWQIRCAVELYDYLKTNGANFTTYSENGVSWTRDTSVISSSLRNEIVPKVGVPKSE